MTRLPIQIPRRSLYSPQRLSPRSIRINRQLERSRTLHFLRIRRYIRTFSSLNPAQQFTLFNFITRSCTHLHPRPSGPFHQDSVTTATLRISRHLSQFPTLTAAQRLSLQHFIMCEWTSHRFCRRPLSPLTRMMLDSGDLDPNDRRFLGRS